VINGLDPKTSPEMIMRPISALTSTDRQPWNRAQEKL
jgi:hypothetical protein